MEQFEIVIPTLLGIESITANEVRRLGYETTAVEDGRVTFVGDWEAVCRANLWIRTGARILVKVASFRALSFEELFEECKKVRWSQWLPKDAAFPVKGYSLKSTLFSVRDCQAILKKSIAKSLGESYHIEWLEETGPKYQIEFSIIKDQVSLMIDTSGESLHKRGYRRLSNEAPVNETIAAAMVILSRFSYSGVFADPFCGSGTIPIEAAMIAQNRAPGLYRGFAGESFYQMPQKMWTTAREEARELRKDTKLRILASDIDPAAVELTEGNSKLAKVDHLITVSQREVKDFACEEAGGTIVCNPPYGERLLEIEDCKMITRQMAQMYRKLNRWTLLALTPLERFEEWFGTKAAKKRKIYNGMIKCDLYQYFPKREKGR